MQRSENFFSRETTLCPGAPMKRLFSCGLLPLVAWLACPPLALAQPPPPLLEKRAPRPDMAELAKLFREVLPAHAGEAPLDAEREWAKGKFALSRTSAEQIAEARVRVARLALALEME